MRCCVLQHLAFEDLGTFAPVLLETGWTIQACHVADGLPDARDWRDADLCIVLGGPMGVHDGAAYPFLSRELELVRSRLGEGRPLLGICLGAQLMAQALGAAVYAGKAKEIGWGGLQLTEAGAASPLAALRGAHDEPGGILYLVARRGQELEEGFPVVVLPLQDAAHLPFEHVPESHRRLYCGWMVWYGRSAGILARQRRIRKGVALRPGAGGLRLSAKDARPGGDRARPPS